jgi:cytochrome c553
MNPAGEGGGETLFSRTFASEIGSNVVKETPPLCRTTVPLFPKPQRPFSNCPLPEWRARNPPLNCASMFRDLATSPSADRPQSGLIRSLPWIPGALALLGSLLASSISLAAPQANLTPEQLVLSAEARGILAHNCTKCHGQNKQKGELRLDKKEFAFKGGENGPVLVAGQPSESVLLQRVTLPRDDDDVMPPQGGKIEPKDIETLRKWVAAGAPWPDGETAGIVFQRAPLAPRHPAFPAGTKAIAHPIDKFVAAYFQQQKFPSPGVVDDRTFLRRASLDAVGLLPTWEETTGFKGGRAAAVKALLNRRDDYATHWLTFWNDALRNDYSGTGYIDGGRLQISTWLYTALRDDKPYDQFVRELIAPGKESGGFIRGIKWRGSISAAQGTELQAAQNVSQVFLGLNLKCASCHDSFINDYKLKDAYNLASIFSEQPLALYRCDKPTGETSGAAFFWPELGKIDPALPIAERQQQFAALLTKKEDGRLARTLVNRLWATCFGRGLIEPVDVMDNRAWNQDLLDWLAWDFAEHGWSVRHTLELILTSAAYQLPSVEVPEADALVKDSFVFRGPVVRRLSAEQFTDALARVATPLYTRRSFSPPGLEPNFAQNSAWIWHKETNPDLNSFAQGKRYFRRTVALPAGAKVRLARALGTADNAFILQIDGQRVLSSDDWTIAESANVTAAVAGKKSLTLAVTADNLRAGAAGLRLALAVWLEGKKEPLVFATDGAWKSSADAREGWVQAGFDDRAWTPAVVLGPEGLPWKSVANFSLTEQEPLVRAALVENDPFQMILGRPIRDQVTMSRPTAATLLQALTFTNGRSFTAKLDAAGRVWTTRFPDAGQRLEAIYRVALLRDPRPEERALAQAAPADLLWAIVLLPEFQLIR